jgi:hypothetical protein
LLEIGGEPPGEIAANADGAVLSPRYDQRNDGIARPMVRGPAVILRCEREA